MNPQPIRVLLVDDEPAVLQLVTRLLREEGHEVIAVKSGEAGLEAAAAADASYDLVITNNNTPGLSGTEQIEYLRLLFPGLPILHLDDLSRSHEPVTAGVGVLYTPFSLEALVTEVRRVMRTQAAS